jgi:hypothetical protein
VTAATLNGRLLLANADDAGISVHTAPVHGWTG